MKDCFIKRSFAGGKELARAGLVCSVGRPECIIRIGCNGPCRVLNVICYKKYINSQSDVVPHPEIVPTDPSNVNSACEREGKRMTEIPAPKTETGRRMMQISR